MEAALFILVILLAMALTALVVCAVRLVGRRREIALLQRYNLDLSQQLMLHRSRQSNGGYTRQVWGPTPNIDRARTTRRDSTDLPSTGRQSKVKRTKFGGDSLA